MYRIVIYRDRKQREPITDFLKNNYGDKSKNSTINRNKIHDYIEVLSRYGIGAGMPYVRHVKDAVWELRPLKNRILFFGVNGDEYVLLHAFVKKTGKTPSREINKAEKELRDYLNRRDEDEL